MTFLRIVIPLNPTPAQSLIDATQVLSAATAIFFCDRHRQGRSFSASRLVTCWLSRREAFWIAATPF